MYVTGSDTTTAVVLKLDLRNKSIEEAGFSVAEILQKNNQNFIEKRLGINFDEWYSEDEKLRSSLLNDRTLAALKMKELVYEKRRGIVAKDERVWR